MSDNTFDTTWLNTRFPFDEAARAPQVNHHCLNHLLNKTTQTPKPEAKPKSQAQRSEVSGSPTLHLLDVGSGTGANFLHFFEKIPSAQNWYFLDHDPRLLQASIERIKAYATAKKYPLAETENGVDLQWAERTISIQILSGSFENLESLVPLENLDIVMASAFFDLFTPPQLHIFLDKVFAAECALLLTLNYAAMTFSPVHPLDQAMVGWYEQHMQRPKTAGQGMGPDCSRLIRAYLEEKAMDFVAGPSVWKIGGKDRAMLQFLLGFMEEAIGELGLRETEQQQVAEWLALRRTQMEAAGLGLEVAHFDFFASA